MPNRKKDKLLICKFCEKEYYTTTYEFKRSKFCSHKCHGLFSKSKRLSFICQWCAKQYFKALCFKKTTKFCSYKCLNTSNGKKQPIGINSPFFKNGTGLFRKLAKELLPIKCSLCESKKYLNVHHVDGNRENNNISNLIYLCRSCHNRAHNVIHNIKHMKEKLTSLNE